MTTIALHRLRLRSGERRRVPLNVELASFVLGGQQYELSPASVPSELGVSLAADTTVFELRFHARLIGPCMRCLGPAEVAIDVSARELHNPEAPQADDLRSEYVGDDALDVGAWARDAIALALPEQILCRPDCAGLCPVCGKDLNAEPHEHLADQLDPRWAALESLRESL